jgi:hypothetical protein
MNLLYVLAHPRTIVVTTDGAFVNRLHQTHLPEALRVQLVDEFNDRLRAKTLAPLVSLD